MLRRIVRVMANICMVISTVRHEMTNKIALQIVKKTINGIPDTYWDAHEKH